MDRRPRFVRLDAGLLLVPSVVLVAPGLPFHLTSAHSGLDHSSLEADAVVSQMPFEFGLSFTQELEVLGTDVLELVQEGSQVTYRDAALDLNDPSRKRVTITDQEELPSGIHTVQWVSLSAEDGEEELGSFSCALQAVHTSPIGSPLAPQAASPAAKLSQVGS